VLSHHFFTKKWPRAELDGLFALETATRKIILPVGRMCRATMFSVLTHSGWSPRSRFSEGLPAVVEAIIRAIEVSDRTREVSHGDAATLRITKLAQTFQERNNSACFEQAKKVQISWINPFNSYSRSFSPLSPKSPKMER